ncbi:MAG: hypothetical protein N5P05_001411 [Chroococcopsis gigantea SAG 12.99]|jgi:ribosomal protein L31E|nr:hypothetical protein [Chlorogloea purpurea SAG 13.99]MDV2999805.1 hypothetical protein [Chroococcopsis gigantea SAG 12.99]
MRSNSEKLARYWRDRLQEETPSLTESEIDTLVKWLLGKKPTVFDDLNLNQLETIKKGLDYRYKKLKEGYWKVSYHQAYRHLIGRLYRVSLVKNTIRSWIKTHKDAQKLIVEALEEIIQDLISTNVYIQEQMEWISTITESQNFRNILILASLEEYCLRQVNNQNILIGRIINYFKKLSKKGIKNIPKELSLEIVSDTIILGNQDSSFNIIDTTALTRYQEKQTYQELATNRQKVKQEFETYLQNKLAPAKSALAIKWLNLYLDGHGVNSISGLLGIPVREVYRLREKVIYHANNFAKNQGFQFINDWLETSVAKKFGLTEAQWLAFWDSLSDRQQIIVNLLKEGRTFPEIGQQLSLKKTELKREWEYIYNQGQKLRSQD